MPKYENRLKESLINLLLSNLKLQASFPRYWAISRKTGIKNMAGPIQNSLVAFQSSNVRPNAISTIPDNRTTKFLLNGTQSGTDGILLKVR
jgi:hypothetical protein